MSKQYVSYAGLQYFWSLLKKRFNSVDEAISSIITKTALEFIQGTHKHVSNVFTGVSQDYSLWNGKHILYYLPHNGTTTGNFLNLTLANGTTTGNKPIWYNGNSRLTLQYGAGCVIPMTYIASKDAWICNANYDIDNYNDSTRLYCGRDFIYCGKSGLYCGMHVK